MTYLTNDGEVIKGASPLEIVTALRDGSRFASNESLPEFMAGMSKRYYNWNKAVVRFNTEANFVDDLTTANFLTKLPD